MMPQLGPEIVEVFASVTMLLAWLSKKIKPEDQDIIDAHEFVGDKLGDSDFVRKTELLTGKNLREQLTVQQMQDLEREIKLLKMGNQRN